MGVCVICVVGGSGWKMRGTVCVVILLLLLILLMLFLMLSWLPCFLQGQGFDGARGKGGFRHGVCW